MNNLRIASPCPTSWDDMKGDDGTRFCGLCELNVHNISEMSSMDVERLMEGTAGRVCGRLYRRADGSVITSDCPVGLRAYRRKVARFAGAALATVLGAFSLTAHGQKEKPVTVDASKSDVVRLVGEAIGGKLTGLVVDPNGAVIPNAKIALYQNGKKPSAETTSDAEGRFSFDRITVGVYELRITDVPGFRKMIIQNIEIKPDKAANVDLVLEAADGAVVLLGIIAQDPIIEMTPERKTVITQEMLDRMPRRRIPFDF